MAEVHISIETEHSPVLIKYFASFGDSVRSVHFRDKCNEIEMMYLSACYCKNITVLRCTNVSIPLAFHALLMNNPNLQEIWVNHATCTAVGLMENLVFQKLQMLSIRDIDCPIGFPWSRSTQSNSLQRVECSQFDCYVDDMKALTQNCQNLRSFSCERISIEDVNMKSYLSSRPELINLNISNNSLVTDDAIRFITQNLRCLRTLNVQMCNKLTIASLVHVAKNCNMLEVLYVDIKGQSDSTERAVEEFSQQCTRIKYLNIYSDFILCHTTCTTSLLEGCPALLTLVINDFDNITPSGRKLSSLIKPHLQLLVHDECTAYNVLTLPI